MVGYEYFTRISFNSAEWKAGKSSFDKRELRGRMIADLTNRYQLQAMPREELIELLGEPDEKGDLRGWDMGWVTGHSMIDPLFFVVRFSSQGRVMEYETDMNFG